MDDSTPTPTTSTTVTTNTSATTPTSEDFSLPPRDPEEFDELISKYRNAIVRLNDLKDSKEEIEMKKLLQELNNNLEVIIILFDLVVNSQID